MAIMFYCMFDACLFDLDALLFFVSILDGLAL